jgi:hypothetical protein
MPGRGQQTFKKRQKEQQRKDKQQEKMAKRLARKDEIPSSSSDPDDEDELPGFTYEELANGVAEVPATVEREAEPTR